MIELLFFVLGGCLLGAFTGLVPGIHVNLISVALIISLMGCAAALDVEHGVEMRPGEAAA